MNLGIDLGGTNVRAGLVDDRHRVVERHSVPTRRERGAAAVLDTIVELCHTVAGRRWDRVRACGIGAPGPLDRRRTRMLFAPNMPGWTDVPFPALLRRRLRKPVFLENDANCAAYGESVAGHGRGVSCLITYTLGTGVGGGIIWEGRLWTGADGGAAELGHMVLDPNGRPCGCGRRGCLEAYSSASSIARRYQALGGTPGKTVREIFRSRERAATRAVSEAVEALARAIANMTTTLSPDVVVLFGGVSRAGSNLYPPLRSRVRELVRPLHATPPKILRTALGDDGGLIGAAALAAARSLRA